MPHAADKAAEAAAPEAAEAAAPEAAEAATTAPTASPRCNGGHADVGAWLTVIIATECGNGRTANCAMS